jgi:hypothetical protein
MTKESAGVSQKALGLAIDKHNAERLLEEVGEEREVREVAGLASLGLPQAGAWLLTAPILALGLHLQASEFIMAAKYQLGCTGARAPAQHQVTGWGTMPSIVATGGRVSAGKTFSTRLPLRRSAQ